MHKTLSTNKIRFYSYLPVFIVSACLLVLSIYADEVNSSLQQQKLNESVLKKISVIRARLEANIFGNAQLVRGLVSVISTEPDMSQERFVELTSPLLDKHSQIRNIAGAPDLVISLMSPVKGNEKAIGLDYKKIPAQLKTVKRAAEGRELILAGPVNLVQGGQGFIARIPVFVHRDHENAGKFWGIVSAVIDLEKLYTKSGLYEGIETLDIAIRGKDALGAEGASIYGNTDVFNTSPVAVDILLPNGRWQIAANPKGGWQQPDMQITLFRLGLFTLSLIIITPLILLSRFLQKKNISDIRFRSLFEHSPVGISLINHDTGNFVNMNKAMLQLTGYTKAELEKLRFKDITPEPYHMQDKQQLITLQKNRRNTPYEKQLIRKDGSYFAVRVNDMIIEELSGEKLIWSFIEDINKRKEAEVFLQRSQKMDAVGQLTGGIAHDFNNILNIILGNLDLLKMDIMRDSNKIEKRIDTIKKAGNRAVELTKKLLSFSRHQAGKQEAFNINILVDNMKNLIARSVTPEIEVTHDCADNLWLAKIDAGDFEDSLLNLCINARDAMSSHGHLNITTRNVNIDKDYSGLESTIEPGDYIELCISDDGHGMSAEEQERIFEPFYTTKEDGKGTGLGLSMVYGFVKRSNGFINIDSEPERGTTIKIYLPRSNETTLQSQLEIPEEKQALAAGNECILVVDDESSLLELTREILESTGYQVLTATDGIQALELLEHNKDIKLLFSDVVMPGGINGYQLADKALKMKPELKILLTSGYTDKALGAEDEAPVHAELLVKPYSKQALTTNIRAVLDDVKVI